MKPAQHFSRNAMWSASLLLIALTAGCGGGGGRDEILGMDTDPAAPAVPGAPAVVPAVPGVPALPVIAPTPEPVSTVIPDTTRPTVTLTTPGNGAQAVAPNTRVVATFSEAMDPASINDTSVTLTGPGTSPVRGTVAYAAGSRSAVFKPTGPATLAANTTFTGTISGARDVAGNSLASDYVWTFTTAAENAVDNVPPTVLSSTPGNGAASTCSNQLVNVTFSEAMDPSTINAANFSVERGSPRTAIPGTVTYDAASRVASFASTLPMGAGDFIVTVTTGVTDLADNALTANRVSTFSSTSEVCPTAPPLGAAARFGAFGGTSTLTNDGTLTVINGDLGVNAASTKITGLRDRGANIYTITPDNNGFVNGLIYTLTAPPGSVAGEAVRRAGIDALAAFNAISPAVMPGGIDVSKPAQCASCGGELGGPDELAGRTLPPGVYKSATGTYDIGGAGRTTADLTLDAGGDPSAVWIFQTAAGSGKLNVGLTGPATPAVPIQVKLINGGQAKNVYWYVPAGAVIGTGATIVGTILADAAITISTTGGSPPTAVPTTINGRVLSLTAGVTMTNTLINTPAP